MANREQTAALLELYFDLEERIIEDMARRIATYDYFIPAAQHQLRVMEAAGACREDIYRRLSQFTKKSEKELAEMLKRAVEDELAIDRDIYRANNLDADTAIKSDAIAEQMKAGWQQTNGSLHNITKTTASLGGNQLQRSLDNAWLMVESGAFSTDEVVRQAVTSLAEGGLEAVRYKSGRTLTLEAAVSMCVRTGVSQTAAKSRVVLADELGCDLVEVTAHAGARPEHAAWQGSICSLSGKSRKYPSLERHTGYGEVDGLCGANCRHTFYPWFEGNSRNWTEKELAALEEKKYEYRGKKLTEYEAEQVQRGIERNIRKYKRKANALAAAGQDSTAAAVKLREWQARQRDFLAATGLKRQSAREQVAVTGGTMPLKVLPNTDTKTVINCLQEYEKGAILDKKETACVITKSGEVYKIEGTEKHVYPDELLGEKLRGAWVSHNHTREETEYSFSDDDIRLFQKYDLTVLRGCDERYTYELNRNADDVDELPDNVDWQTEEGFRHCRVVTIAKENGLGYRRCCNEKG